MIEKHAEHLEAQAFVALMTFVISLNDGDSGEPNLFTSSRLNSLGFSAASAVFPRGSDGTIDHVEARERLITTMKTLFLPLDDPREFIAGYDGENSPFKTFKSLSSVARALDLYWALENGYLWANANGYSSADYDLGALLNQNESYAWIVEQRDGIESMWEGTLDDGSPGGVLDINAHEVQAGNWPLQGFIGAAYAVMGHKVAGGSSGNASCRFYANEPAHNSVTVDAPDFGEPSRTGDGVAAARTANSVQSQMGAYSNCDDVLSAAIRHAKPSYGTHYDGLPRRYYWAHQTSEGEKMWAEGPYYFELTLTVALPYWHALRANDYHLVDWPGHADESMTDPFTDSRILDPVRWHADLVSPDGRTVPLDDGNRTLQLASSLMRWSPSYGAYDVGRKYAWIHDASTRQDVNAGDWLHVQEIAIPRLSRPTNSPTPARTAPPAQITNASGDEQQVLYRYSSLDAGGQPTNACATPVGEQGRTGECHFVLLNGEHGHDESETPTPLGAATSSGEGHEQPDGLQLLYSVDGRHVLDDAGYTSAPSTCGPPAGTTSQYCNDERNDYRTNSALGAQSSNEDVMGGVQPPWQNGYANKKNSDQRGVFHLSDPSRPGARLSSHGPVVVLGGQLAWQEESDGAAHTFTKKLGRYRRSTLFVRGENPYIIDINRGYVPTQGDFARSDGRSYVMRYALGGATPLGSQQGGTIANPSPPTYLSNFQTYQDPSDSSKRTSIYVSELERSYDTSHPNDAPVIWEDALKHGVLPAGDAGDPGLNYPNVTANEDRTGVALPPLARFNARTVPRIPEAYATFVSFVVPCQSGECDTDRPAHSAVPSGTKADVQYYSRSAGQDASGADLLDVVLVRSAGVYAGDMSRVSNTFSVPSHTFGANRITLPASKDEGFVRFRRVGGNWVSTSASRYNVSVTPLRHLTASMGGPSSVQRWSTYTWTANTQYGIGSGPTYRWDYMNTSCSSGGGSGPGGYSVAPGDPSASPTVDGPRGKKDKADRPRGNRGNDPDGDPGGPTTNGITCNEWTYVGNRRTQSRSVNDASFKLRLTVRRGSETVVRTRSYFASGSGGGGLEPVQEEGPEAAASHDRSVPDVFALHSPAPNPVHDRATLGYDVPEASDVRVVIYDARGRVVRELVSERVSEGHHEAVLDMSGLAGGVYIARMTAGAFSDAQAFTVVR